MLSQARDIFSSNSCEDDIKTFVNQLLLQHSEFRKAFTFPESPVSPEELEALETSFKNIYPNKKLTEVVESYRRAEERDACSNMTVYDPKHKKTYTPKILTPIKQKPTFNTLEFLKEQQSNGQYHQLNFDLNYDICVNMQYEDKKKFNIMVDNSLKSMGELVLRLNQIRSEIPYNLVELHNEARIN